ncbi:MAG: hypothetical protein KFF77_01870 [Bacteroidetes bacterium]|nr:hypothetical protein [Bacteroidota bacterium]
MRFIVIPILLLVAVSSVTVAQDGQKSFGISFSGFVKTDMLYDSRETVNVREGHFLLYPAAERAGAEGVDLNETPSFNMLSIQTRLKGDITGPEALGARTSGQIEGEFFGMTDGDINGFRLRHAFVKLDWGSTALLVGQTWHPMFVAECYPGVVSFNTGAPFQPFSRNPQVRVTQSFGGLRLIGVAATQRDFPSIGPDASGNPVTSSMFLRHAILPNLHFQAQYLADGHVFGAGVDYKQLLPSTATGIGTLSEETIAGTSLIGYAKLDLAPVTIKAEGTLGQNLSDLLQFGGFAMTAMDAATGEATYTTLDSYSVWGEVMYGKEFEVALFAGYSENLGAEENFLPGALYARGANIASLLRVSPRVQYTAGKVRFALELEYTSADYGTPEADNKGLVADTKSVANTRVLAAVFYFF